MIFQIKPNKEIDNKHLESALTNLHRFKPLRKRVNIDIKNRKFDVEKKTTFSYEILLKKDKIEFFYIVPEELEEITRNELNICYPKATIAPTREDHMISISDAIEFELTNHSFMSLKVETRAQTPLSTLLEGSRVLRDNETVLVQVVCDPVDESWSQECSECIDDFKEGHLPKRLGINYKDFVIKGMKGLYYGITEVLDIFSLLLINEEYKKDNIDELAYSAIFKKGLSENTLAKGSHLAYNVSLRVATNSSRKELIMSLFQRAFTSMEGDNKLVKSKLQGKELFMAIKKRETIQKINENILSVKEIAQITQMPLVTLQKDYPIESIDITEVEPNDVFLQEGGIRLAKVKFKNRRGVLSIPVDDPDSLCQMWLSIGKMGSGKTTNGENISIQMLKHGFSVFAIDVADGGLIDHIESALPKDFNKVIDLDFGDTENPIPLNWSETALTGNDPKCETKLASQLKNFLNKLSKEPASDRMERYLGACAKAVYKDPKASLFDVILCLTDRRFRDSIIKKHNIEGRLLATLKQLDDGKDGTKGAYIAGVMDRIEALIDNDYVSNCLLQRANPELNFRKWADEGYFVGIRIPKGELLDEATDLLVTYVVSKLWLAILTRSNIPISDRKPCFLVLDEPHQFPTVLLELYNIIREMRKWRLGIVCLAHEFKDFKSMKSLLKSAGTNYFIYTTSKETWNELLEELEPYKLDELLKLKWHHSMVSMRYKTHNICIEGDMFDTMSPLKKGESYPRKPNIWGRPRLEVEQEILDRQMG